MKTTKIFKTVALSALLLSGSAGAALAQNELVSGEPYAGFFNGTAVQANGPVEETQVATEAPGRLVSIAGRSIHIGAQDNDVLAGLLPQAFIGIPAEVYEAPTAIAQAK